MQHALVAALLVLGVMGAGIRATTLDPARAASNRTARDDDERFRSPGPAVLAATSLQHRLALSDLFWLGVVQELGIRAELTLGAWNRAEYRADVATDLDPLYFTVYHSLALAQLGSSERLDQAEALLQKGWDKLPSRWEFPLLLGYSSYFLRGDPDSGADYMAEAAQITGSPSYLGALAGRMRYHSGDAAGAIMLLEELIEHLEEPARTEAETRLKILRSEPRLEAYDRACRTWQSQTGKVPDPKSLEVVVGEPAQDLLDSPIYFKEDCVARTAVVKIREFEARRRVGASKKGSGGSETEPQLDIRLQQ